MLLRIAYVFFIIGLLCSIQAQTVDIAFDQLDEIILKNSPDSKILRTEHKKLVAESNSELQWSNPELELEREAVGNDLVSEHEFIAAAGKTITMPWVGSAHKSMWKTRIKASEYFQQSHYLDMLAHFRFSYVEIQLLAQKKKRLSDIHSLIQQASKISHDRMSEGTISGIQNNLLQISLFTLNSSLIDLERQLRSLNSEFKLTLGIEQNIRLSNHIRFKSLDFNSINPSAVVKSHPAVIATNHLVDASQAQVKMERGKLISKMGIRAGYKKVGDDLDGYIVGLSLPIPVLNQNRAKVQQQQLQTNILEIQTNRLAQQLANEINNSIASLKDLSKLLSDNQSEFEKKDKIIEDLVYSFKEGWIELGDLLEGIRIYSESLNSYYENLALYYKTAFQLEKLSGKKLVRFQEAEEF